MLCHLHDINAVVILRVNQKNMAYQRGLKQAAEEGHLDLHYWAEHTLEQIRMRMHKQRVWPYGMPGPYHQYKYINERKKKNKGAWVSTGSAAKEMYARVYSLATGDSVKIAFFFEHYLNMVDMGVGKGRKIEDVQERAANARWNKLFARWGGQNYGRGKSQGVVDSKFARRSRPMLMMELRHQSYRLQHIVSRYMDQLIPIIIDNDEYNGVTDVFDNNKNFGWLTVIRKKTKIDISE